MKSSLKTMSTITHLLFRFEVFNHQVNFDAREEIMTSFYQCWDPAYQFRRCKYFYSISLSTFSLVKRSFQFFEINSSKRVTLMKEVSFYFFLFVLQEELFSFLTLFSFLNAIKLYPMSYLFIFMEVH